MQSLEEVKEEENLNRKVTQKHRVTIVLAIVCALLAGYAGYLSVDSIVKAVNKGTGTNQGDIITLTNKDEAASKTIYEKYVGSQSDILDVATYGRYLLTSTSRISYTLNNDDTKYRLLNLSSANDSPLVEKQVTLGTKLDEQFDLFSLDAGDYIILKGNNQNTYNALHYTGEEYYVDVIYSFPTEDGTRTKITIKGKASSPALVISVSKQEASLPEGYYDIVILDTNEFNVDWFGKNTNLKVKKATSLAEAYATKASYAINVVDGSDIISSNYVSVNGTKPELINEGIYSNLDEDNAIRELGGYTFNAGYGLSGDTSWAKASREIKKVATSSHVGKYTLSVGKDTDDAFNKIKEIFNF